MQRYMDVNGRLNTEKAVREGLFALVAFILCVSFWPLRAVPTGSRGVVTVFGKITTVQNEGATLLWPWEKLDIFSVRNAQADVDNAPGSTADTQPVAVDLTVRYSLDPNKVAHLFEQYSHNGDLSSYVQTATAEVFKAVTAKYKAPELISQRAIVSADLKAALAAKLEQYGVNGATLNIDMRNFEFSKEYMAAINAKVTQEQLRLGAENEVKTQEAKQRVKVVTAEADATALKLKADGEAYATLAAAKVSAESLRIQNAALAQNRDVLELRRIEVESVKASKWNGALPQNIYASAPIPFFNLPNNK